MASLSEHKSAHTRFGTMDEYAYQILKNLLEPQGFVYKKRRWYKLIEGEVLLWVGLLPYLQHFYEIYYGMVPLYTPLTTLRFSNRDLFDAGYHIEPTSIRDRMQYPENTISHHAFSAWESFSGKEGVAEDEQRLFSVFSDIVLPSFEAVKDARSAFLEYMWLQRIEHRYNQEGLVALERIKDSIECVYNRELLYAHYYFQMYDAAMRLLAKWANDRVINKMTAVRERETRKRHEEGGFVLLKNNSHISDDQARILGDQIRKEVIEEVQSLSEKERNRLWHENYPLVAKDYDYLKVGNFDHIEEQLRNNQKKTLSMLKRQLGIVPDHPEKLWEERKRRPIDLLSFLKESEKASIPRAAEGDYTITNVKTTY